MRIEINNLNACYARNPQTLGNINNFISIGGNVLNDMF